MQLQYWNMMTLQKYSLIYLNKHFENSVKIDRRIKIFMAIASCSSIAAWTIWQQFAYIWGVIIAISQLIGAIYEILPFKKRIEELSSLKSELSALYLLIEKEWYPVSNGDIPEAEINELIFKHRNDWDTIDEKYFKDDVLPVNEEFREIAEDECERYFCIRFGGNQNANE